VAISPDGTRAYVAKGADSVTDTVSVINTLTNTVIATVDIGNPALAVVVSPDGVRAYVTKLNDNTLSVIDTATNTVTTTITVGLAPAMIVFSPDGGTAYVTNAVDGTLSVIDTATDTVTSTVDVGDNPVGLAVGPDGSTLYVTNAEDDIVSVISRVFKKPSIDADLVGKVFGGADVGAGGFIVIGNHFYKIPPHSPLLTNIARAAAPRLGRAIVNRRLGRELRNVLVWRADGDVENPRLAPSPG